MNFDVPGSGCNLVIDIYLFIAYLDGLTTNCNTTFDKRIIGWIFLIIEYNDIARARIAESNKIFVGER